MVERQILSCPFEGNPNDPQAVSIWLYSSLSLNVKHTGPEWRVSCQQHPDPQAYLATVGNYLIRKALERHLESANFLPQLPALLITGQTEAIDTQSHYFSRVPFASLERATKSSVRVVISEWQCLHGVETLFGAIPLAQDITSTWRRSRVILRPESLFDLLRRKINYVPSDHRLTKIAPITLTTQDIRRHIESQREILSHAARVTDKCTWLLTYLDATMRDKKRQAWTATVGRVIGNFAREKYLYPFSQHRLAIELKVYGRGNESQSRFSNGQFTVETLEDGMEQGRGHRKLMEFLALGRRAQRHRDHEFACEWDGRSDKIKVTKDFTPFSF